MFFYPLLLQDPNREAETSVSIKPYLSPHSDDTTKLLNHCDTENYVNNSTNSI